MKAIVKVLKWLDRKFDHFGMRMARYYLKNFCHYK
jgi:hypothetical protein